MRSGPILLALLLTAGCNLADRDRDDQRSERVEREATGNDQAVSEAPDNGAAERNEQVKGAELASSSPRDPGGVNREWFAGSWTDSGDCAQAGEFNRDGRYRLADGTRGMWNVREGRLVVENANGRNEVRLRRIGDDVAEIVNQDGSVGRSVRCNAGSAGK